MPVADNKIVYKELSFVVVGAVFEVYRSWAGA